MRLPESSDHPDVWIRRPDAGQMFRTDRSGRSQDLERRRTAEKERDPENGWTRQTGCVHQSPDRCSSVQDKSDQEQGRSGME